jgi:glycosyltransferase involved in cell wall biosynthesis
MEPARAPLFSLITVSFNAAGCIRKAIDSVRAQTFRDFEYLVIDGGSTDETMKLVNASRDVVTHAVSEKDRGISDAFNKGVLLARGTLVGFVNADDWYEPDALQRVASEHARSEADVYCGLQRYWDETGRSGATFDVNPSLLRQFMSVNHIASFARRSLFVEHGGFKLSYRSAMDYELYLRFFVRGARFRRTDAVLANMSLGGVSDRNWKRTVTEVRRAQIENGIGRVTATGNYLFQLAKGAARRELERMGGRAAVELYRNRIARVRKSTDA